MVFRDSLTPARELPMIVSTSICNLVRVTLCQNHPGFLGLFDDMPIRHHVGRRHRLAIMFES